MSIDGYPTYSAFDDDNNFLNDTYDSSLLYHLQLQLELTYEPVARGGRGVNQTWNEWIPEVFESYDMILTYWSRSSERQNLFSIPAHTSNNRVIVISRTVEDEESGFPTLAVMHDYFRNPFTSRLWTIFFSMFAVNAVGLYLVEYDHHEFRDKSTVSAIGLSLYLSFALLTGACDLRPNTAAGRLLFGVWGVCIVLSVAWYTGDLAGSQAAEEIGQQFATISELRDAGLKVCYPTSTSGVLGELDALEQVITYEANRVNLKLQAVTLPTGTSTSLQIAALEEQMARSGGCKAMVVPEKGYHELLRERESFDQCDMHPSYELSELLVESSAGWALSYNMSGCLGPALEWAFQTLRFTPPIGGTNVMENLENQYLTTSCASAYSASPRVALSHLGLVYSLYLLIAVLTCMAAGLKRYKTEYFGFVPECFTPASEKNLPVNLIQMTEMVREASNASRTISNAKPQRTSNAKPQGRGSLPWGLGRTLAVKGALRRNPCSIKESSTLSRPGGPAGAGTTAASDAADMFATSCSAAEAEVSEPDTPPDGPGRGASTVHFEDGQGQVVTIGGGGGGPGPSSRHRSSALPTSASQRVVHVAVRQSSIKSPSTPAAPSVSSWA